MQFIDKEFGVCNVLYQKEIQNENICVFASYTDFENIPKYVYYYLSVLNEAGFSIVFIQSSVVSEEDTEKLSTLVDVVIEKENIGTDFGAWKVAIEWLNYGTGCKSLYLCNDSVFGPFYSLKEIHNEFLRREENILGLTDSNQGAYHLQSYFLGFKSKVLNSSVWRSFWSSMIFLKDKNKVIDNYEIGLSQNLLKSGFSFFVWSDWQKKITYKQVISKVISSNILYERWLHRLLYEKENFLFDINPSSFLWKELILKCRHPFIKREIFVIDNLFNECETKFNWEKAIKEADPDFPLELIKDYLIDHFLCKKLSLAFKNVYIISNKNILKNNDLFFNRFRTYFQSIDFPNRAYNYAIERFDSLGIENVGLVLKNEEDLSTFLILIKVGDNIFEKNESQINEIKTILNNNFGSILILVPELSYKSVLSTYFSINQNFIYCSDEAFYLTESSHLVDMIKFLASFSDNSALRYHKPSMSDIVNDALNEANVANFLNAPDLLSGLMNGKVDYNQSPVLSDAYYKLKAKYHSIYERTPYWYKVVGHFIKLFTGRKVISVSIKDKGLKTFYESTPEDLAHWYYHQYEVFPNWYKKVGYRLTSKINKNELPRLQ